MLVSVGDVRLFVEVDGLKVTADGQERPTVVCLHGGPGLDCSVTKRGYAFLSDVAQVVHYDHRGNGRSDDGDRSRWTLEQWADDVVALCDALGIERPVVLGGSFGGFVAQVYAARHPDHPAAVGLVVTTPREAPTEEIVEAFRRLGGDEVAQLVQRDVEHSTPETSEAFDRLALPLMSRHPDAVTVLRRHVAAAVRRREVELHFNNGEMRTMDLRPLLRRVRRPVLVVSGELDPVCPPSSFRELVEALPPELVEAHLVPGAGHLVALDAPDVFQRVVRDFVLRHGHVSARETVGPDI